jgi:hypothetical protein
MAASSGNSYCLLWPLGRISESSRSRISSINPMAISLHVYNTSNKLGPVDDAVEQEGVGFREVGVLAGGDIRAR